MNLKSFPQTLSLSNILEIQTKNVRNLKEIKQKPHVLHNNSIKILNKNKECSKSRPYRFSQQ